MRLYNSIYTFLNCKYSRTLDTICSRIIESVESIAETLLFNTFGACYRAIRIFITFVANGCKRSVARKARKRP